MSKAITNISPPLYLRRVGGLDWLPRIFAVLMRHSLTGAKYIAAKGDDHYFRDKTYLPLFT